ncbi:Transformation system protein [hydrothermal vent metagenome]|uniref:Transformation system protein n=1 Tax=hydrothermal vent metagenome TaxID=652676 RepID=A0A1W1CPV1_9ZZZZ
MDKIRKLEQRWKRYKTVKTVSFLLFISIFYLFTVGGYYTFLKWDSINTFFSKKVILKEKNISKENIIKDKIIEKEIIKKEESNKTAVTELYFNPIIPIIDMEKEKSTTSHRAIFRKEKSSSNRLKAKPSTYLTAQELSKIKVSNHKERDTTRLKRIHIGSSSKNYIETMKKKFFKSKKPRDALLLAKAFYREKKYKESNKWALEANKLNSNLDESWIIFAQSKAKMGKKNEAIKILAMYYRKSKSPEVRAVIEKIKMEKL